MNQLSIVSGLLFVQILVASCGKNPASANKDVAPRNFQITAFGSLGGSPNQAQSLCINDMDAKLKALPVKCSQEKLTTYEGQCPLGTATPGQGWVSTVTVTVSCP